MIREANEGDWDEIFPFFRAIVDAGETYAYPSGLEKDEARELWMERPPALTVVAQLDSDVVGSAKMGPNHPGRGSHVATASFMVSPQHQSQGVGMALGKFMIAWARESGYHSVQFNAVVETNSGAVHLWESLGFVVLATVPKAFDHAKYGLVGLHVMYLPL
jgi:GNAT superfamily N-acetyltransferase